MGAVIELKKKRQERHTRQEQSEARQHVLSLLQKLSTEDKKRLQKAIETKDMELWKEVTEPVIMRDVIKEMNKEVQS